MLFNSLEFLVFFVGVVVAYFATPHRLRWPLLLIASYWFYAAWRPEYLLLIWASTLVDYVAGLRMSALPDRRARRPWLAVSLAANLGLLAVFKYFDFFGDALGGLFRLVRLDYEIPALNLLLPVGISFYTFQTLSYSLDVYRGHRKAERHLGIFALYVAFFPQLVAGPIERSTTLMPQFFERVSFDAVRVRDGLALMLLGFFKKCVVADRLAVYVDPVFARAGEPFEGLTSLLGTYFFAWQIYCDFSGYSDIAIGAAGVLGYRLMTNFRRPFLAQTMTDFWARWHISMTTWFRDYLFFSMSKAGMSRARRMFYLVVVFTVSGLWHGAGWGFVLWGTLNGLFLVAGMTTSRWQRRWSERLGFARVPALRTAWNVTFSFHVACFALVLFRSSTLEGFTTYWGSILSPDGPFWNLNGPMHAYDLTLAFLAVGALFLLELLQERHDSTLIEELGRRPRWVRWPVYYVFLFAVLMFGEFNLQPFFYFQF